MARTRDQEAAQRYEHAICAGIAGQFFRRTGHLIAIEVDEHGLYIIKFGHLGIPEQDASWEILSMRKARAARKSQRRNVLPHDEINRNYALSELLRRLVVLETFLLLDPAAPLTDTPELETVGDAPH